jgi:nucleoside-diphosphate-sugar epimerase
MGSDARLPHDLLLNSPSRGEAAPSPILITGAAGNLGSLLARHLISGKHHVRLMFHRTPLPNDLARAPGVEVVRADLAIPGTLPAATAGAGAIVHFAGMLFRPRPERFLPETNARWFSNLLTAALEAHVGRMVLMSFPQVEGPTSVERPATGRLDQTPISVHAQTRLQEERMLLTRTRGTLTTPVVLRLGMIYGRGIRMVDAARWLARHRLLGVWREPTLLHLLSTTDYLRATESALTKPGVRGVYHVGDEQPITLQEFLDQACRVWGCSRPMRVPFWFVELVATLCEAFALVAGTPSPLTRDFVRLGRVPHWGDTRRAREELLPRLQYPTLESGRSTL